MDPRCSYENGPLPTWIPRDNPIISTKAIATVTMICTRGSSKVSRSGSPSIGLGLAPSLFPEIYVNG
jgi:hypothetical protein